MNTITIDEILMEKLLIKSHSLGIDVNELANIYISKCLEEDEFSVNLKSLKPLYDLDYDKVEGDNILQRMCGIIDIDCELDAVQLKKYSGIRKI